MQDDKKLLEVYNFLGDMIKILESLKYSKED
jgi:hypothetical protein